MNFDIRSAIIGAVGIVVLFFVVVGVWAALGVYDVGADAPHWGVTRAFIGYVIDRSTDAHGDDVVVPSNLSDPKRIADGASDYDAMCTGCHLAPGMAENEMRPGLYPHPPRLAMFQGEAGEQFWIIKHGIKMSAMPAWGKTHSDEEIWNMVAFLQRLPKLSPAQYQALVKSGGGHHDQMNMDMGH